MIPVTSFAGRKVAVFGLGASGRATAEALVAGGAVVVASDDSGDAIAAAKAAGIPVLICGMIAPRNLGPAYSAKFDPMFKALADKYQAPLYPFILDGVALDQTLNQADGMHPNKDGAAIIAKRLTPAVEKALPLPKP